MFPANFFVLPLIIYSAYGVVNVQIPGGSVKAYNLEVRSLVSTLKATVKFKEGILAPFDFYLGDKKLDDGQIASEQGVTEKSVLGIVYGPNIVLRHTYGQRGLEVVPFDQKMTLAYVQNWAKIHGLSTEQQIIDFNGIQLTDPQRTLWDYGVRNGDTIIVKPKDITARVRIRNLEYHLFNDYLSTTVEDLHTAAAQRANINKDAFFLSFQGRDLEKKLTLSQQGVPKTALLNGVLITRVNLALEEGSKISTTIQDNENLGHLKAKIEELFHIPKQRQELTIKKKTISDPDTKPLSQFFFNNENDQDVIISWNPLVVIRGDGSGNVRISNASHTETPVADLILEYYSKKYPGKGTKGLLPYLSFSYQFPGTNSSQDLDPNKSLAAQNVPIGAEVKFVRTPFNTLHMPGVESVHLPHSTRIKDAVDIAANKLNVSVEKVLLTRSTDRSVINSGGPEDEQTLKEFGVPSYEALNVKVKAALSISVAPGVWVNLEDVDFKNANVSSIKNDLFKSANEQGLGTHLKDLLPEHIQLSRYDDGHGEPLSDEKTLAEEGVAVASQLEATVIESATFTLPHGEQKRLPLSMSVGEMKKVLSEATGISPEELEVKSRNAILTGEDDDLLSSLIPPGANLTVERGPVINVLMPDGTMIPMQKLNRDGPVSEVKMDIKEALHARPHSKASVPTDEFQLEYTSKEATRRLLPADRSLAEEGVPFGASVKYLEVPTIPFKLPGPEGNIIKLPTTSPFLDIRNQLNRITGIKPERLSLTGPDGVLLEAKDSVPLSNLNLPRDAVITVGRVPPLTVVLPDDSELPMNNVKMTDLVSAVRIALLDDPNVIDQFKEDDKEVLVPTDYDLHYIAPDGSRQLLKPAASLDMQSVPYGAKIRISQVPSVEVSLPNGTLLKLPLTYSLGDLQSHLRSTTNLPPYKQRLLRADDDTIFEAPLETPLKDKLAKGSKLKLVRVPPLYVQLDENTGVSLHDVDMDKDKGSKVKEYLLREAANQHLSKAGNQHLSVDIDFFDLVTQDGKTFDPHKTASEQNIAYGSILDYIPIAAFNVKLPDDSKKPMPLKTSLKDLRKALAGTMNIPEDQLALLKPDGTDLVGKPDDSILSLGIEPDGDVLARRKSAVTVKLDDETVSPVASADFDKDVVEQIKIKALEAVVEQNPDHPAARMLPIDFDLMYNDPEKGLVELADFKTLPEQNVPYASLVESRPRPSISVKLPDGTKFTAIQRQPFEKLKSRIQQGWAIPLELQEFKLSDGKKVEPNPALPIEALGLPPGTEVQVTRAVPLYAKLVNGTIMPIPQAKFKDSVTSLHEQIFQLDPNSNPEYTSLAKEEADGTLRFLNPIFGLAGAGVKLGGTVTVVEKPHAYIQDPKGKTRVVFSTPYRDVIAALVKRTGLSDDKFWLLYGTTVLKGDKDKPFDQFNLPSGVTLELKIEDPVVVTFEGERLKLPQIARSRPASEVLDHAVAALHRERPKKYPHLNPSDFDLYDGETLLDLDTSLRKQYVAYGGALELTVKPEVTFKLPGDPPKTITMNQTDKLGDALRKISEESKIPPVDISLSSDGSELKLPTDLGKTLESIGLVAGSLVDVSFRFPLTLTDFKGRPHQLRGVDPVKDNVAEVLAKLADTLYKPTDDGYGKVMNAELLRPDGTKLKEYETLANQNVSLGDTLALKERGDWPQLKGKIGIHLRGIGGVQLPPTPIYVAVPEDMQWTGFKLKEHLNERRKIPVAAQSLMFRTPAGLVKILDDSHTLKAQGVKLHTYITLQEIPVSDKLRIRIMNNDDKSVVNEHEISKVARDSTIIQVKNAIIDNFDIPGDQPVLPCELRLETEDGRTLEDDNRMLKDYNIELGSTVDAYRVASKGCSATAMSPQIKKEVKYRGSDTSTPIDELLKDYLKPGKSFVQDGAKDAAKDAKSRSVLVKYQSERANASLGLGCFLFFLGALVTVVNNVMSSRAEKTKDSYARAFLSSVYKVITSIAVILSMLEVLLHWEFVGELLERTLFGDIHMVSNLGGGEVYSEVERIFDEVIEVVMLFVIVYIAYVITAALFAYHLASWLRRAESFDLRKLSGLNKDSVPREFVAFHALRYEFVDAVIAASIPGLDPPNRFFVEYLRAALLALCVKLITFSAFTALVTCGVLLIMVNVPAMSIFSQIVAALCWCYLPVIGLLGCLIHMFFIKRDILPPDCVRYVTTRWNLMLSGHELQNDQREEFLHLFPRYSHKRFVGKSVLGDSLARLLYRTTAPNPHESLFWLWKNGPAVLTKTIELCVYAHLMGVTFATFSMTSHVRTNDVSWIESNWIYGVVAVATSALITAIVFYYVMWNLVVVTSTSGMIHKGILQEVWEEERAILVRRVATFVDLLHVEAIMHKFETQGKDFWEAEMSRAHQIPVEVYDQNLEIFTRLDVDGDGLITEAELYSWLKSQGINCQSEEDAKRWFLVFDHDGSGGVDRAEFFVLIVVVKQIIRGEIVGDDIKKVLEERFGISTMSIMHKETFRRLVLQKLHLKWSPAHAHQLFDLIVPAQGDEEIDAGAFVDNLHLLEKRMLGSLQQAVGDLKYAHGDAANATTSSLPRDSVRSLRKRLSSDLILTR